MCYEENQMVEENTDRSTIEVECDNGVKVSENWTRNASTFEVESELVDSDGLKVVGGADFQNKYGEHQKIGAKLDVESPDMGGVRAFLNVRKIESFQNLINLYFNSARSRKKIHAMHENRHCQGRRNERCR
jgi:hypothetical protein